MTVNRAITSPRLKIGLFCIEGLNSLSTTSFFYYIYFLTKHRYGFGALENFSLAAGLGLCYAITANISGRFAQKQGYLLTLRCSSLIMISAFVLGTQVTSMPLAIGLMAVANVGMSASWPALESQVSYGEPPSRLQGILGTYNVIWATCASISYFSGGAMIEHWGWNSMFLVPAGLQFILFCLVLWIQKEALHQPERILTAEDAIAPITHESLRSPVPPRTFLKMGWLANPFGYLASNTVISAVPTLALTFNLSKAQSGFLCSIWLFVRTGAFVLLWLWPRWHYRFRYLTGGFIAMTISFITILLTHSLWLLILAQVVFGIAVGLLYYSSLFYSMDVGEATGEHSGMHEAVIGAGCFAGPAVAACGLKFFPETPSSGAWAVAVLLLGGLSSLFWLRYRK